MFEIKYYSTSNNSHVPTKATPGSAGFDLYSAENKELKAWSNGSISTDLKFRIPDDMFGKIFSHSGQFLRDKVTVEGGVIDSDYRETLKILLFNHSSNVFEIKKGQRIAQIVFFKKVHVNFNCVESFEPEVGMKEMIADLVLLEILIF